MKLNNRFFGVLLSIIIGLVVALVCSFTLQYVFGLASEPSRFIGIAIGVVTGVTMSKRWQIERPR